VTVLLRRAGKRYDRKRIRRVMRGLGLQIPAKGRRRTGPAHAEAGRPRPDRSPPSSRPPRSARVTDGKQARAGSTRVCTGLPCARGSSRATAQSLSQAVR